MYVAFSDVALFSGHDNHSHKEYNLIKSVCFSYWYDLEELGCFHSKKSKS